MPTSKFKVRRDFLAMQSASVKETLLVDGGITGASTLDVTKGVTLASTLAVTKGIIASSSLALGSGGTEIKSILAGSVAGCPGNIASSATGAASYALTGLTTSHRLMVTPASVADGLAFVSACIPAAGSFLATYANVTNGTVNAACSVVYYIAFQPA